MTPLTLVTTDLAARELRADDALARRRDGERVWQPAPAMALPRWIEDCWAQQWPSEQLFSQNQLLALWLEAVHRDPRPLLAPRGTARLALAADQLLRRYRIDLGRVAPYTQEHAAFRSWREHVDSRLRGLEGITPADLPAHISTPNTPTPIRLHPAVSPHLLAPTERELLMRMGLEAAPATPIVEPPSAWQYPDLDQQFMGLAERLRERWLERADTPFRALLAVPDADAQRGRIEAALTAALAPWRETSGLQHRVPWRWAQGAPLADTASAMALMTVARLTPQAQPAARWLNLLLSPALWRGEARAAAAELEVRLRRAGAPLVSLDDLVAGSHAPLTEPLLRLSAVVRQAPQRALPSVWSRHFLERILAMGGARGAGLDSRQFQIERAVEIACGRLAGLDRILGQVSASTAAQWAQEWLALPFQPRVEHAQSLLIGRPQDLIGIPCDVLILANATSEAWLARPGPNPLIPYGLLQDAGIAEAHPVLWRQRQADLFQALLSQAQETWIGLASQDERGTSTRPCPWIDRLTASAARTPATPAPSPAALVAQPDPVPPIAANEAIVASAGTFERLLRAPLLALAVDRLGCDVLPALPYGVSPSLQGSATHAALATLWGDLQTRDHLLASTPDALRELIQRAVRDDLDRRLPVARFGRVWRTLEQGRMEALLAEWLAHEGRRCDPFTVIAREHLLSGQVAGLPVSLRLDRADHVDTVIGARTLLIDYKTGTDADPRGWRSDRLAAPQLPLYAVLARSLDGWPPIGGIAFAHLKPGHPTLSARTEWTQRLIVDTAGSEDPQWQATLDQWQAVLSDAAQRFLAGDGSGQRRDFGRFDAPFLGLLSTASGAGEEDDAS